MQTKGNDILKKPVPMRASSSELNQKKYYRYHRSAGHDIDNFQDLKDVREKLIRRGHLKEFLAPLDGRVELSPPRDWAELPHPSHLNRTEVLSSAIAKPDVEKFSFSEEDPSHVLQPHSDAVVITMPISRINIHRTLVNDESFINILYIRTFKQMEIDV
ncbi:Uncharacterized protein Adt_05932 [Abeliophyllum distichum]|uniref:Uncharacterized protein n=1 Tax=Abeliophyllum distichum TaxID=126358 RepID=A0ABD1V5W6_9LAMI